MELRIEQPCPTCGASITIGEDDRLVQCDFCDVHNYKISDKIHRYLLPAPLPPEIEDEDLFYIPYLRFKGCIYTCSRKGVAHKLIDTTRLGVAATQLPPSLGLRPQAMKLLPMTAETRGRCVVQTLKSAHIFREAARLTTMFSKRKSSGSGYLHRAFIGETVSRVYLPVFRQGQSLVDGVRKSVLCSFRDFQENTFHYSQVRPEWEPRFLSTLCPHCGDLMTGDAGTLVMRCDNCSHQWFEEGGTFHKLQYSVVAGMQEGQYHLPFWRIEPETGTDKLHTFADFLSLTNQPIVIRKEHHTRKIVLLVPAFKIKPDLFLSVAKNLTLLQERFNSQGEARMSRVYPVTLGHREAVQSLKSVVAASAVSRKNVVDLLPEMRFRVSDKKIIYLPFADTGHDYVEQTTGVSIPSVVLRFGTRL